jgi:serine/threonine-protein kinase
MGSVWLAEHLSLHTPVAIKLIDFEAAKNPNARARFEREAQVAARIRSAHVVKILDHGVTEQGQPYIAMECLAGESLRDRLSARGRLTPAEAGRVISHVSRALARAHEAGLVHRDLKPENIFVARVDDEDIVKILDFGVAKVTDILAVSGMDPTRTGALLGTPYYMSPEQAQGLKTLDFRSDLWSLAVVAFECLTGQRPFSAPALGPLIGKILGGPIPTLSGAAPDARLPRELEAWMARGLSRDPAARFGSAKELSESFLLAAGIADTLDRSMSTSGPAPPVAAGGPSGAVASATATPPARRPEDDPDTVGTIALDLPQATRPLDRSPAVAPTPSSSPAQVPVPAPAAPAPAPVAPSAQRPTSTVIVLVALVIVLAVAVVVLLLRH